MTTTMRGMCLAVTVALLAACDAQDMQTNPRISVVGDTTTVELPIGQAATLGAVSIRFDSVGGDSRCPTDVTCVWAGNAELWLTLAEGGDSTAVSLNTTVEPLAVEFASYRLSLSDLTPHPASTSSIPPSAYVAKLAVVDAP